MSPRPDGAIARVPTTSGSRYLQQLCKHWSHNLQVEFDANHGRVTFPAEGRSGSFPGDGTATMNAEAEQLVVRVHGHTGEQVERLKQVVASHLDRFAFREAPLPFDWQADPAEA